MTRMTVEEFKYMLAEQDTDGHVLFVEGVRDLRFFSILVPQAQRSKTTILPINAIQIDGVAGGERGRAIWLADNLTHSGIGERIRFFLDADSDDLLEVNRGAEVLLTDFRDMESYAINECCLKAILYSAGKDPSLWTTLEEFIVSGGRDIGFLRLANDSLFLNLPFAAAFLDHPSRCFEGAGPASVLNTTSILRRLKNISGISGEDWLRFKEKSVDMSTVFASRGKDIICGKDLTALLARFLQLSSDEARRLIHAALLACLDVIRALPRLSSAEAFARL